MAFKIPGSYYPARIAFLDRTDESSVMEFNGHGVDPTGTDGGVSYGVGAGAWTDFRTALAALVLGTMVYYEWGGVRVVGNAALPASNNAQRENKLLITYQSSTTFAKYQLTVPTVDLGVLSFLPGAKDNVSLTAGVMPAFVTAFQNFVFAPVPTAFSAQQPTTILSARFVGRNN